MHQEHKKRNQEEVLDSEALSNLFREKPKSNVVAKAVEGQANQVVKSVGVVAYALTMLSLAARLPFIPVSMSAPTAELSGQQTSLSQTYGTSTVNLSPAHYVPVPQVMLESKANEFEQILNNALKSAKNNFGISQNSSEPQWFKDLNKSETIGKASDAKYIDTNGTCSTDYETAFINTHGSLLNSIRRSANNVASFFKVGSIVQPLTQSVTVY